MWESSGCAENVTSLKHEMWLGTQVAQEEGLSITSTLLSNGKTTENKTPYRREYSGFL